MSDSTSAAVRTAVASISPHLRDGTISNLHVSLPGNRYLYFASQPFPSVTVGSKYTIPLDASASHVAALEVLQDLEYSYNLKIKFASIDNEGRYVGDSHDEYESFLAGLPEGWRQDSDDYYINTRFAGTRRAWHLRNKDLDVAVVEHETGVELLLAPIAVGIASSAIYDLIKWGLKKWREKRESNPNKSPTFLEIERMQRDPNGNLLGSEVVRIRGPVEDLPLRSTIERMTQDMPSDTTT